jgi:hypothetical protein
MMRIWFYSLISFGVLYASPISAPLLSVEGNHASIEAAEAREGMSGFIVRHFDGVHSSIIANAHVEQTNPSDHRTLLRLDPFDGLHQKALPGGSWSAHPSDEAVLAYDYTRALLIAPNEESYDSVAKSISGIEWIHPDLYATYLSYEGHPTPLVKDFHAFCTANSIGLLYIQDAQTLFTLDCKSFALLEAVPSLQKGETSQTPFFTHIPKIRAAWWGEGSSRLTRYEPYYLEQIALNNSKNQKLYELYQSKFSEQSALLRHFKIKE